MWNEKRKDATFGIPESSYAKLVRCKMVYIVPCCCRLMGLKLVGQVQKQTANHPCLAKIFRTRLSLACFAWARAPTPKADMADMTTQTRLTAAPPQEDWVSRSVSAVPCEAWWVASLFDGMLLDLLQASNVFLPWQSLGAQSRRGASSDDLRRAQGC